MIDRKAIRDNSQGSNSNNNESTIAGNPNNSYKAKEERKGVQLIGAKNHLSRSPSD
jgi:hypothetical protein